MDLLLWPASVWDGFAEAGFPIFRVNLFLMPFCLAGVLALRRDRCAYGIFWTLGVVSSLAGVLGALAMLVIGLFAGGFAAHALYFIPYFVPYAIFLPFLFARRPQRNTRCSTGKLYATAFLILALSYYGGFISAQLGYRQYIVLQALDINGNILSNAKLVGMKTKVSIPEKLGKTNELGRVGFYVDTRTIKYSGTSYIISKAGYNNVTITVSIPHFVHPTEEYVKKLVGEFSVQPSLEISYFTQKDEAQIDENWEPRGIFIPLANSAVITVILSPEQDKTKPDYSKALFGELLSDENAPQLTVKPYRP